MHYFRKILIELGIEKASAYSDFIKNGGKDSEWEAYRQSKNKEYQQKTAKLYMDQWHNGETLQGNSIVNHLRLHNIDTPEQHRKALQHDDTKISKTHVEGRGMTRPEAKKIHKWVSEKMNSLPKSETSNEDKEYFHVTPTKNVPSILKQGLKPSVGERSKKLNEKPSTFLFHDKDSAHDAVTNWLGDEFEDEPLSLLKVRLPSHIKVHKTVVGYESQVFDHIHPKHILIEEHLG